LIAAGLVSSKVLVKVLAKGELTAKVDVEAHAFSQKAEAIITEKGGNAVKL
jgi:large subunit ribosomal protein L15